MKEKKSCGIIPVIKKEGEDDLFLLVHQRINDTWSFPKGGQEKGESDRETALRELREETGIEQVEILENLSFRDSYFSRGRWFSYHKSVTYFVGLVPEEEERRVTIPESEIKDFAWLSFEKAIKKLSHESTRGVLREAKQIFENSV